MITINEKITEVCLKKYKMEKTYSPMEFKRKVGKFYISLNKYTTPITSLPLSHSKTNIYFIDSEIHRLKNEIDKLNNKSKKMPKNKRRKLNEQKETKSLKLNNRENLRNLYTALERRMDKIATKYGYTKKTSIDRQPIWMKAITSNSISIIELKV